jgi:predicted esterase
MSNTRLTDMSAANDLHAGERVLQYGIPTTHARLTAILLHGRGSSPEDMLALADQFTVADVAYMAPAAAGNTWYPQSFLAPIVHNEPALSSAMRVLERLVASLGADGVSVERLMIIGFSQGACLGLEFAARHAGRYAGVVALSGGLIGPAGTPRDYAGSLAQTPVFLGCSDIDPHIPLWRVHESAEVLGRLDGVVDERIYPGMGHTVNRDEIDAVRLLLGNT